MPPTLDDLTLCRELHQRRRVPEGALRAALAVVGPGRSLARVLVERGLLAPGEVAPSSLADATFAPPSTPGATCDPDLQPRTRASLSSPRLERPAPDTTFAPEVTDAPRPAAAPDLTRDPERDARLRPVAAAAPPPGDFAWMSHPGALRSSAPSHVDHATFAAPEDGPAPATRSATADPRTHADAASGSRGPPPADWKLGGLVGRFRLDRELGRGGMGVVYAATDVETGRRVAIKTLLPDASEVAVRRFLREGQAQAAVDEHPNVLRVHQAGEAGGRQFLVMDLAPGGDLAGKLKQGPLPPREAAALGRDLARGLAHVHARGVLHRDLKPANVLFDEHGVPRLVDFGLATLEGADRLTQTGAFMGTPAYMAPEQTGGERVTESADIYGLGAIIYHMLCGRVPFEGESGAAMIGKLLTQPPPPPRQLVPAVPEALERIVLKCLAKQPAQRYASAASLAADLERALAGEEVEARPAASGRGWRVAGGAAALLVPALVAAHLSSERTPDVPPPSAVAPTAPSAVTERAPFDPLAARAFGLPEAGPREYRLQWYTLNVSPAFMSLRATLTLGPAQVDAAGVVTCPATLSRVVVWAGAPGENGDTMGNDEYDFDAEGTPLEMALVVTVRPTTPPALEVSGVDGARMLQRIPEPRRWNPLEGDLPVGQKRKAWLGVFARSYMTDALVGQLLRLALPRLANEREALALRAVKQRCAFVKPVPFRLLLVHDDHGLPRDAQGRRVGSRVDADWALEPDGTLQAARFEEQADEVTEEGQGQGRVARAWLRLGAPGSFTETRR